MKTISVSARAKTINELLKKARESRWRQSRNNSASAKVQGDAGRKPNADGRFQFRVFFRVK